MDENHRDRPPVESFLLVLCMACPGVLLATLFHLNDLAGGRFSGWMTPSVAIPWFVITLSGCCWFAGWILESGIDEVQRLKDSLDTGLLVLVLQFLLAPVVAFVSSCLFDLFF
jgi:ABC-type xylose transport system permease subunit